jgi:hypothetical protein
MLFSLYPTDTEQTQQHIVAIALKYGCKQFFFSLHIPEAQNLQHFLAFLKQKHQTEGLSYTADISPLTLKLLNLSLNNLSPLKNYGITALRIDFGFNNSQIIEIGQTSGLQIAINASTVTKTDLEQLAGLNLIGWHNYYPRPQTALSTGFFTQQNSLLKSYGIPIYAFIAGEAYLRAPLAMGLPTIEAGRFLNGYVAYLQLKQLEPSAYICLAEGLVASQHLEWIKTYEAKQLITLPLAGFDPLAQQLNNRQFFVRIEQTDSSWRLEESRKLLTVPQYSLNNYCQQRGSVQMDMAGYGRYEGELHIMTANLPLHPHVVRVAEVASPYVGLVDTLAGRAKIMFKTI